MGDQNVALAPTLAPFVRKGGGPDDPIDVDDGLYNFLSPKLPIPSLTSSSSLHLYASAGGDGMNGFLNETGFRRSADSFTSLSDHGHSDMPSFHVKSELSLIPPIESTGLHSSIPSESFILSVSDKPEWFQRGQSVEDLLKQAEGLDWLMDTGTPCRDDDPLLRDTTRPSFGYVQIIFSSLLMSTCFVFHFLLSFSFALINMAVPLSSSVWAYSLHINYSVHAHLSSTHYSGVRAPLLYT